MITAPFIPSLVQSHHSRTEITSKELSMSPRKFSGRNTVRAYRRHFAMVWRDFIRDNFESPAHVAHVFKVDPTTSEKWWSGSHAPQGWVVGMAMSQPETREAAIKKFTGESDEDSQVDDPS